MWPAQFAKVTVTLDSPEALTVPSSAIQTSQTGQYVYVIKADKTAELRPVVIERFSDNDAVIGKGLTEGETVVVDGQLRVIPGKPVDIKTPGATRGGGRGGTGGEGKGADGKGAGGKGGEGKGPEGKGGEGKNKKKDQEKKAP